jgi:Cys-rich four helix bundle protein (predicted Tat secretion target)
MAGDDHHDHHESSGGNGDLVRAAGACETTGELCQAHCQAMLAKGDTSLAECSRSVHEMMAGCSALMKLAAVNSKHLPAMAKLCSQILDDCRIACEKHEKHDECKACAEACEACIEECNKVAA